MNTPSTWHELSQGLAVAIPVVYFTAAATGSKAAPFRQATYGSWLALGLATLFVVCSAIAGAPPPEALAVRLDAVTSVMLLLVTTMGMGTVRYSTAYLDGDQGSHRYSRWLLATLGAVTTLIIANNLLMLAVAWTATSLALHQLLTFYDRPAALVAAHKKFLASRLADAGLLTAIALMYANVGSLNLDAIHRWANESASLPPSVQLAAVLFALSACIKSAQIPLHGWLTQVMEAPTPVSALLHAGVVNIGGFLMIRLAPLMVDVPAAQLLLVVIGMTSTVVGALIMTTRVSVKVALAWSTCAQMGFMLVQCGLGAWDLALLHLVAHSLYKAHAFLTSGSTVEAWRVAAMGEDRGPTSIGTVAALTTVSVAFLSLGMVGLSAMPGLGFAMDTPTIVFTLIVALSLVPMVGRGLGGGAVKLVAMQGLGVAGLYFLWHAVAGLFVTIPAGAEPLTAGWVLVATGFIVLFVVQTVLQAFPDGSIAHSLHHWLFAAFYLDERFTRLTFRVWPPHRIERSPSPKLAIAESLES